ncbi:hypothetical protein [Hyalangium gracile]|uniref:hypothetical protein n=1 Tax=Hyalangium gracile TaxID=394092 RepID=UPI001CCC7871|nr:hypothetical protein [Hyalangium gracile]
MRLLVVSVSAVALAAVLLSSAAVAGGDDGPRSKAPPADTSRPRKKGAEDKRAKSLSEAWHLLPQASGPRCGDDLAFDYGDEGGMRNFFCRALSVISWKTFLSLAPVKPFRSGPHQNGKLNLQSSKDFGRYDPAFVKWATTALVPAATDEALRQETQAVYDRSARTLARTYYRVWRALSANSSWVQAERKTYLSAAQRGATDAFGPTLDFYHEVLGTADENWGGHDPNHVRSATAWWIRRSIDDTAPLWAEGLERLLTTYDGEWLSAEKKAIPRPLPARSARTEPEYK